MRFYEIVKEDLYNDLNTREISNDAALSAAHYLYEKPSSKIIVEIVGKTYVGFRPEQLDWTQKYGFDELLLLIGEKDPNVRGISARLAKYPEPIFDDFKYVIEVDCLPINSIVNDSLNPEILKRCASVEFVNTLSHELIHFLDMVRTKNKISKRKTYKVTDFDNYSNLSQDQKIEHKKNYYNDDAEFNAYYQEIAADLTDFIRIVKSDPNATKDYMDMYNFPTDFSQVLNYGLKTSQSREFIKWLNDRNRKALLKRLYRLHQEALRLIRINVSETLSPKSQNILRNWSEGKHSAGSIMQAEIVNDLKQTIQQQTYTLYRGYKFHNEEEFIERIGKDFNDIKSGEILTINSETPESWTLSTEEAKKFSDPTWSSFEKKYYDDEDYDDVQIYNGDLIGIGLMVKATISSDSVLADLTTVPKNILHYSDEEQEIIVKPGSYKCEVILINSQYRQTNNSQEYDDFDLDAATKEQEQEQKELNFAKNLLPKIIKRMGGNVIEVLNHFINEYKKKPFKDDEALLIAFLMNYGNNPEVIQLLTSNSPYPKTLKHFSLRAALSMIKVVGINGYVNG